MVYLSFMFVFYLKIILVLNIKCCTSFNVNFHYNYNVKVDEFNTEIQKREAHEFHGLTGFHNFNGFERVLSIPLVQPMDICMFKIDSEAVNYAAALHVGPKGTRHLVVFKIYNDSFAQLANIAQANAICLHCRTFNNKAYVAIVSNITQTINLAKESSTIYEIYDNLVKPIQYFTTPKMLSMHIGSSTKDSLFMLQTFAEMQTSCPYFIYTGETFSQLGSIPCSWVHSVASFEMNDQYYMAMANSKEFAKLELYKFSQDAKQFELSQILQSKTGCQDVQYFSMKSRKNTMQHFLICVNSNGNGNGISNSTQTIVYVYNNRSFEMFKKLPLKGVTKLITLKHMDPHQILLIAALEDQSVKVLTFQNDEFLELPFQYASEAFGHGITSMRNFDEAGKSFLIIANRQMTGNRTNVFRPLFKKDARTNSLRQHMVDWVEAETKRLEQIDVNELNEKIENKLQVLDKLGYSPKKNLENSKIHAVITENLIYPKLKMSTNYWKALYYINQAVDVLEEQFKQRQQQERSKRNTPEPQPPEEYLEYMYNFLDVNTLTVNQELKAKYVNGIDVENPEFREIRAPKIVVKNALTKPHLERTTMDSGNEPRDVELMEIENLQIEGKLNEYSWNDLVNNTLKCNAEIQFIKSPIKINNLKAQHLMVTNNEINGQHLTALIPIDGGSYVINQDIQFAAPITAKHVYINERLNNVHVFGGKLDVLLKRTNETQVIEGVKNVNNIKVMEPITIAGQLLGKHLRSITPNKAVHEPLELQGDFTINGHVAINGILKTDDIIDLKGKMSLQQIMDNAIRMDEPVSDVKLKFLAPLKVNNSRVSFVNENDLQRLIKLNHDEIQIVEGEKTFANSLEIQRGFSEVKNLNGIDMEKLEKSAFLKHNNQTIEVPMKFGKIQTKRVAATSIQLHQRNITEYLTKTGNQTIEGNLVVNNLQANTLHVERLNTNNRIFQQNLHDIYQQKSRNAPQADVLLKQHKFHGSIYVQNLILNATINGRNVEEVEQNLLQLEGNIKYVGNFKFNYPLDIRQLRYHGKLNDIKAEDLGKCWLLKSGQSQQQFMAAQTMAKVNAAAGIQCQGKMNEFDMQDFFERTYWINKDEYIPEIVFENPIEMSAGLNTASLNSNYAPADMLYLTRSEQFLQPLVIEGDLEVVGKISNVSMLNGINLYALDDYLHGGHVNTLHVQNAHFARGPPLYKTLNGRSVSQLLDTVWLANENVVLPQKIAINEAHFDGLLLFKGAINDMNLEFLKHNYLSKTQPQNISVNMIFDDTFVLANIAEVNDVELFGDLIDADSHTSFNFMRFVANTLKTSGPHVVSGNWSILQAIVDGDLNQVMVNDLNLINDVVHHSIETSQPYNIKSLKVFQSATIEHLLATPLARLNNVAVSDWINDAVYLYENFTIRGITTLQSLNVYNDLRLAGKLNNLQFNENTLLLQDRDQTLHGNLRIISYVQEENRFLTNNIDNMFADFVNSEYVPNFMENVVRTLTNSPNIQSHVVFQEPLKAGKYQGPSDDGLITLNAPGMKRSLEQISASGVQKTKREEQFLQVKRYLEQIDEKAPSYAVDHFEIIQEIKANATECMMFSLKTAAGVVDILVLVENKTNIIYYKWIEEKKKYEIYPVFPWFPSNPIFLSFVQKLKEHIDTPIDVKNIKDMAIGLKNVLEISKDGPVNQAEFLNSSCVVVYKNKLSAPNELKLHCLDAKKHQISLKFKWNTFSKVQQMLPLNHEILAVLSNNSLEVWNISASQPFLAQKLPMLYSIQMAFGDFKNTRYLAVLAKPSAKSLNQGTIEILRSVNNSDFAVWQTLNILNPINLEFMYLPESQDLLLLVLSQAVNRTLLIYKFQGVMGFQEVVTDTIVPANGLKVKAFKLKSSLNHVVTVVGRGQTSIMDIVLRKL